MAKDGKRKGAGKARTRREDTYQPVRRARMKKGAAAAPEPLASEPQVPDSQASAPPAPEPYPVSAVAPPELNDPYLGEAVDDGLRILAALEELDSLEPDVFDDPAGEASVTIIECTAPLGARFDGGELAPPGPRSAGRGGPREVPGADVRRLAIYQGLIEEAEVEIFEGPVMPPAGPDKGR